MRYVCSISAFVGLCVFAGIMTHRALHGDPAEDPVPLPVTWFNEYQMEAFRQKIDAHVAAHTVYDKEGRADSLLIPYTGPETLTCIYVEKAHQIYVGFGFRFDGVVVWRYESPERAAAFQDSLLRIGGVR